VPDLVSLVSAFFIFCALASTGYLGVEVLEHVRDKEKTGGYEILILALIWTMLAALQGWIH